MCGASSTLGAVPQISQVAQGINVFLQDLTWTVGGPGGVLVLCVRSHLEGDEARDFPPAHPLAATRAPSTPLPTPTSLTRRLQRIICQSPRTAGVTSLEVTVVDITDSTCEPVFLNVTEFTNGTPKKFYSPVIEPGFVKVNPGVEQHPTRE